MPLLTTPATTLQHRPRPSWPRQVLLAGVAALGALALYHHTSARRAERENPPEGHFIEVDGVRLHYVERGSGEPVVLLHGNGATVQDFEVSGVLDQAAKRFRVIAFDRPGYGYSQRPRGRMWTPSAQARLLAKAFTRLGIRRPIVLGHSWGALVTMALTTERLADLRAVVLVSGYYFPSWRRDVLFLVPAGIPVLGDLLCHTVLPLAGRIFGPSFIARIFAPAPVPASFRAFPVRMSLRPSQLRASAEETLLMEPAAAILSRRYHQVAIPAVIISGDGDRLVDAGAQSGRLHQILAQSSFDLMQGAGHMPHHLAPGLIVAAIERAAGLAGGPLLRTASS
ncbi:alpha/beta fold hydrolase [Geminicoccus flavidas]|uniref:alpha/beta fold hydrolase n=1 Tax=Geminicoccus flavidas TaxID=2506407 RepID=UPI00135A883D|nr:alpha/beta hydrolase [Geminicoccus flavidas]